MTANDSDSSLPQDLHGRLCWLQPNCNRCVNSAYLCGWCASSQLCVPLPDKYPFPLLHPVFHPHQPEAICPAYEDRWDFRTRTLGCYVSSLTVVACVVTVLCTLLGLLLLIQVVRLLNAVFAGLRVTLAGQEGWQVWVDEDGTRYQEVWRPRRSWRNRFAVVVPSSWGWDQRPSEGLVEERRPLLQR